MNVSKTDPFEALLHRYRGMLYTLCRRYGHRGATADDLLQEASIALWKSHEKLETMDVGVQQAALVWKIARNAMIDTLRRVPESEPLPEGFDQPADDNAALRGLREAVETLTEPDRTIVKLQLEGYSYEEIGEQVGMTEKNVSVRIVRAKEKLRRQMTE